MAPRSPEQPPPEDSSPEDDKAWHSFSAELMGKPESEQGVAAAEDELRSRETEIRRWELEELIFKFSDLLVAAPRDFPDLRPLEHIASAAAKLIDPVRTRPWKLRIVTEALADALTILQKEASELEASKKPRPES